jgi:hypothetical protein
MSVPFCTYYTTDLSGVAIYSTTAHASMFQNAAVCAPGNGLKFAMLGEAA